MENRKKIVKRKLISSLEDASVIRKFTILFVLMSFIPMSILLYFYMQLKEKGAIDITESSFNLTLLIMVTGILVGYLSMRSILQRLIDLTWANKKALENILTPQKIEELSQQENEIAVLAQSFKEITSHLEENVRSLELAKKTLHSIMSKVGQGISNMDNIDTFLDLILETATEAIDGEVGVLAVFNDENKGLWIRSLYGDQEHKGGKLVFKPGTPLDTIMHTKQPLIISQLDGDVVLNSDLKDLFRDPIIIMPLIVKEKFKGFISVTRGKTDSGLSQEDINLFFNLASQTAVAIENAKLNEDIEKTYFETITALALAVDAKDKYSRGHLDRVAQHCVQIGKKLGMDDQELKVLKEAARLHDIGKIGIPDEVLQKGGSLTDQEWILMRAHPEIGESIIKPIRSLSHLCDIIRHHHEKLDGSGYPDGLKGDQISPLVRITTIADIFDALTTDRPYRGKMSNEQAINELRRMNNKIDQDIVEVFAEILGG